MWLFILSWLALIGAMSKELNRQQSLSAVSLSDLIDSALQLYGIPATAVKRISGSRKMATLAPDFAWELHPDRLDGGRLMLIGDAAMRVSSSWDLSYVFAFLSPVCGFVGFADRQTQKAGSVF